MKVPIQTKWQFAAVTLLLLISSACQPDTTPTTLPSSSQVSPTPTATLTGSPTASVTPLPSDTDLPPTAAATASPSVDPSPVVRFLTQSASSTPPPATNTPFGPATRTPWPTRTPTLHAYQMNIKRPGPNSLISSPVRLEAVVSPGEDSQVYVQLLTENGNFLYNEALSYDTSSFQHFNLYRIFPFQILTAGEAARLALSSRDRFGRTIYLASVDFILLRMGTNRTNPPSIFYEPYIIDLPKIGGTYQGGVLPVNGMAQAVSNSPLIIELINQQGVIVGSAEVTLAEPSSGMSHAPFVAYVTYSVPARTAVRLTLRQESSGSVPGTVWLTSRIIYLDP